jgi:hypothetical protein
MQILFFTYTVTLVTTFGYGGKQKVDIDGEVAPFRPEIDTEYERISHNQLTLLPSALKPIE